MIITAGLSPLTLLLMLNPFAMVFDLLVSGPMSLMEPKLVYCDGALLISSAVLREGRIEFIVIRERHRIDSARTTNAVIRAVFFLLFIEGSISAYVVWGAEDKAPSISIPAIVYPKDFDFFVGVHDGLE